MKKLLLVLALASCSKDAPDNKPAPHATGVAIHKDPAAAKKLIEAGGATVLDVRTPEEYEAGHLAQATNIPIDQFASRIGEVDKTKPVVVYCAKGGRAQKAKDQLEAAGFTNVVVNGGGYDDLR